MAGSLPLDGGEGCMAGSLPLDGGEGCISGSLSLVRERAGVRVLA